MAAVAGLTLLGLAIRLANFNQSLLADELSTYWIVHGRSLGSVVSHVRSNDEITPPLYFILGWFSLKLGSGPEWVRLPSLIAGTMTIPLIYMLGARTISRAAGLVAAAVMALSPFMIYYSTEARSYAVMIALVTGAALAVLAAIRTGHKRWWAVYAVCSCASLYTHYSSVFPLAALFVWVLWAHRGAVRSLVLANVAVLIGFAPWIPGFIADNNSPTTKILSALSPFTYHAVRLALENWAVGFPYVGPSTVPGSLAGGLIASGVLFAVVAGAVRGWRWLRRSRLRTGAALRRISPGVWLVALLALAAPAGEGLYSAFGPAILGARDLNASWPGLALAIGGIVTAAGIPLSFGCAALVLSGYAITAHKTLEPRLARDDYAGVAKYIEQRWKPRDVVVDGIPFTPVPLTGLDVYLPQTHPEFRLGLPISQHPFKIGDPVPSVPAQVHQAVQDAKGRSLFLVAYVGSQLCASPVTITQRCNAPLGAARLAALAAKQNYAGGGLLRHLPRGFVVTGAKQFPSLFAFTVFTITDRGRAGSGS